MAFLYKTTAIYASSEHWVNTKDIITVNSIQDLEDFVSKPAVISEKMSCPRVVSYHFPKGYVHNRVKYSRALQQNANKLMWIGIDIDDGMSIDEFKSMYSSLTYALYTTHSHGKVEKGTSDRFRVLFPISKQYISRKTWTSPGFKYALMNIFPKIDANAVAFRCWIAPSVHPDRQDSYEWHVNTGTASFPVQALIEDTPRQAVIYQNRLDKERADMLAKFRLANPNWETEKKIVEGDYSAVDAFAVTYYLSQSFPYMEGNGESDLSLYKAILKCVGNDDNQTLASIVDKAIKEGWNQQQIDHKVNYARKRLQ